MTKSELNDLKERSKAIECHLIFSDKIILVRKRGDQTYPNYFSYDEYDKISGEIGRIGKRQRNQYWPEFCQYDSVVKHFGLRLIKGNEEAYLIHGLHESLIDRFSYSPAGLEKFLETLTKLTEGQGERILAKAEAATRRQQAAAERRERYLARRKRRSKRWQKNRMPIGQNNERRTVYGRTRR